MKFLLHIALLVFLSANFFPTTGATQNTVPKANSGHGQLNIVFHGLFSYIVWPDHLEVLVPQVDEHVYKAGSWGRELRLKENTVYHLQGVHAEAQAPAIDSRNNLVLTKISKVDRSPDKLFCSFILPFPQRMIGLRRAYPPPAQPTFRGTALKVGSPESVPLIQTLVYQVEGQPSLGENFLWLPKDTAGPINLHIWAEPEVDVAEISQPHAAQAFARLTALFPGVDLQLAFSASASPDKLTNIAGLEPWEERSLVERSALLFPHKPQSAVFRRGTEVSNCLAVIVLNNQP